MQDQQPASSAAARWLGLVVVVGVLVGGAGSVLPGAWPLVGGTTPPARPGPRHCWGGALAGGGPAGGLGPDPGPDAPPEPLDGLGLVPGLRTRRGVAPLVRRRVRGDRGRARIRGVAPGVRDGVGVGRGAAV